MAAKRLVVIMFAMILLIITGCNAEKRYPNIDLDNLEVRQSNSENNQETFRVALAAITSTQSSINYYEELLNLLEKELGRPFEIIQRNTYAEINELLRTGQVDMAFICTYAYVTGHDQFGLKLIAAPVKGGEAKYRSYIIVRKDSGIEDFSQLEGRKFAFTDPMSTTGYLYPISLLRAEGKGPERFFKDYSFTYSHDNSIRAVTQGLVDGAAVESLVFQHMKETDPKITEKLKIIRQSGLFASPPVVVRVGVPENVRNDLIQFFNNLGTTTKEAEILEKMGLEGFQQIEDAAYDNVRALGEAVRP